MIEEKEKIIRLLRALFANVKVYLFGSRARGDYKLTSDIDLALDTGSRLSVFDLATAKNVLESLNIPQRIDLVDFHAASKGLQENILREGIFWTD